VIQRSPSPNKPRRRPKKRRWNTLASLTPNRSNGRDQSNAHGWRAAGLPNRLKCSRGVLMLRASRTLGPP
jgi:hypothetical protein